MNRLQIEFKKNPLVFIFQIFLIGLLVLAFTALVSVLFCKSCETCIYKRLGLSPSSEATTPSPKPEALKFIGVGIGGVLLALQALMSYKRAKALEDTAQAQADAVSKTEQGQRQERMKNAIEHLGHKKGSVRLGGAYELFHLAKDTRTLNQTALDILCAHIRQITGEITDKKSYREEHERKPSEEVQSLLTLLFVQNRKVFKKRLGSLQGSHLNGIHLKGAYLQRANLQGAQLQRANLQGAQLQGANLQGAQLQGANLQGTQLQRANLQGAQLQRAQLQRANLQGAQLQGTNLQGTQLQEAQLQGAQLQEAQLQEARLKETNLQGAQLQGAQLQRANLQGAQLQRANLQGAQLQGTYLEGTQLQEARLLGAYLQGTNLEGAHLQGAHLQGAQLQEARLLGAYLQGTNLEGAHLQEAYLLEGQLQGANLEGAHLQGAYLREGQLQGANLQKAHLQSVRCEDPFRSLSFEDLIRESIGKETELSGVVFEGGLRQEDVDSFIEGLSDEKAKEELRETLKPHIDKSRRYQLPENSGAITDSYTAEEAEQWIAKYKEAMSQVPVPPQGPAPAETPKV